MKINLYKISFFIILALPIFNLPPWLYPPDWGKAVIFRSILAILLFTFIWKIPQGGISIRIASLKKSLILWALAGLSAVFMLASIFSVDPYFSFWGSPYRGGGFVTFAFFFIFAILAFLFFRKDKDWKNFWDFSIVTGLLVCAVALCQFYGLLSQIFVSVGERPGSTIGNPIFLGIYLLLLFFPCLSLAINENNRRKKIFYILSLLIFLYVILLTGSRASYLGIILGTLIFLYFYPKKILWLKIGILAILSCIILAVFYVNFSPHFPAFLEQNRVFTNLASRLSLEAVKKEGRFMAWRTIIEEIKEKPILGWGPENLYVGLNKHFDPNITGAPWWDRAHNIFLDIGAQAGILGILAYILLFAALFWQLFKARKNTEDGTKKIIINGLQAALLGYLVANFFSFDSFPTYLIFFFIVAFSLHLTCPTAEEVQPVKNARNRKWRKPVLIISCIALIIFLWQYNIFPFYINTEINIADNWVLQKKCNSGLALFEKISNQHSFISSYLKMMYVQDIKKCAAVYPGKELDYAKKGFNLLKEAVKIQPLYARFWIYLGSFETIIANYEQDEQAKKQMVEEARSYFGKAESLAPKHADILLERAKADMVAGDYQKMQQTAEKCLKSEDSSLTADCYWLKAISELCMRQNSEAQADMQRAKEHGFAIDSSEAYFRLIDVYIITEQYDKLIEIYKILISRDSNIAQYFSSLALIYAKIGDYKNAREQALIFLQLMPEAKDEVEEFLHTLPQPYW